MVLDLSVRPSHMIMVQRMISNALRNPIVSSLVSSETDVREVRGLVRVDLTDNIEVTQQLCML